MFSSINTFSIHYYPKNLQNSLHFNPIIKISPKSSYFNKPNSYYPLITSSNSSSFSPHKPLIKFVTEKSLLLLIGSFIFISGFNKKPVLAQPTSQTESQTQNESQSQSEKSETIENVNDLAEEEMMYMKLLESNPKDVEVLKTVFHGKMKKGKTKEAIQYVERLISIEPKEVEWRLLQALCYEMIGEYSKAKILFKNILKERPLLLRALHVCCCFFPFFLFKNI